ncbi:putative mating-type switch/DNA repair protein Swi10/Rad10 [Myxozyma melibiosi]|uniref:Mating-type switch/DNA repair protein Swi10/Rad10 n=1 Tax=Myxozyma melibiosi TaxID=54550 RepID=A0ABR1FAG4_9ASCO
MSGLDHDYFADSSVELTAADILAAEQQQQPPQRQQRNAVQTTSAPAAASPSPAPGNPRQPSRPAVQQPTPRLVSAGTILVNRKQDGNPVLQHIKGASWEFADITSDYMPAENVAVLFLSLKYHRLHPEYIFNRMGKLGQYRNRILLVVVDIENHTDPIKTLSKAAIVKEMTIFLAWSAREAGTYISLFRRLQKVSPAAIQGKKDEDYNKQVVEVLRTIPRVNKTDAANLLANFGSVAGAIDDFGNSLHNIPGWGEQKIRRFKQAISEPFVARNNNAVVAYRNKALATHTASIRTASPPPQVEPALGTEAEEETRQSEVSRKRAAAEPIIRDSNSRAFSENMARLRGER